MGGKGSKPDKPDFKKLSKETKYSTQELQDFFNNFKTEFPSGKMDKPQFIKLYKKMFETADDGDATEFCGHVFQQYDKDKNGFIDFKEFVTTLSVGSHGTNKEKLHWVFQLYDLDKSGYLTQDEIVQVLSSVYKCRNLPDPKGRATQVGKDIFKKADDTKDNKLSEAEFVKHTSDCPELAELLQAV